MAVRLNLVARKLRLLSHCPSCRQYSASTAAVNQSLHYLHGRRVEATSTNKTEEFQLQNPATGEVLRQVQSAGREDVDRAVESAKEAFHEWSILSGFQRGQILKKAADIIRSRQEEISKVECLDTGKPLWEARFDIASMADSIEYFGGLAPTVTGQHIQLPEGSFAYTRREPLGVCGGIGAWNYPFQMASWKSAPALACGNTLVFKPSPFTPLTAVMLAEIYSEAGLPEGCFNVVQGQAETGQLLSNHPDIAKMSFTGSVEVGSKVMESCAKGIKNVTLELGGKSPCIIFDDCDLDNAVKGAMLANFMTQGQVCSNGTRVFVQRWIMEDFLEKLLVRTQKMKIGDPMAEDTMVGAMINSTQSQRVLDYIELAKKEGCEVFYGGERVTPSPEFAGGHFIRPCILINCHDDMRVVKEEIFGSVMCVLAFDTEEEVIRRANDTEFGLAGGIFTKDINRAHHVAAKLEAGSLYINNYNIYPHEVPFGGYKKSGIGRECGEVTLQYYTQVKSVYVEMNDVDCPY